MRFIANNAIHISLTTLIVILLVGSWIAGQVPSVNGQADIVLVITFLLMIPCALFTLHLQSRSELNE